MRIATLGYLYDLNNNQTLLGEKKYGQAMGKVNGFGGKLEPNDKSIKHAFKREFYEETGLKIINPQLNSVIKFIFSQQEDLYVYVYTAHRYLGNLCESDEMKTYWIPNNNIPIDKMWPSDRLWFPIINQFKSTFIILNFNPEQSSPNQMTILFNQKLNENFHKNH